MGDEAETKNLAVKPHERKAKQTTQKTKPVHNLTETIKHNRQEERKSKTEGHSKTPKQQQNQTQKATKTNEEKVRRTENNTGPRAVCSLSVGGNPWSLLVWFSMARTKPRAGIRLKSKSCLRCIHHCCRRRRHRRCHATF